MLQDVIIEQTKNLWFSTVFADLNLLLEVLKTNISNMTISTESKKREAHHSWRPPGLLSLREA